MAPRKSASIYSRVRQILESARAGVARSVNTTQVVAYWLIGREIVEKEQHGQKRAGYGQALLEGLARRLTTDFGSGFSVNNLKFIRQFYVEYPSLITNRDIGYALRSQSVASLLPGIRQIRHAARSESWKPGQLHPDLSWTHYRTLLRVDKAEPRAFYEIEASKNNWSARELERQIHSKRQLEIRPQRFEPFAPAQGKLRAAARTAGTDSGRGTIGTAGTIRF